MKRLKVKIISTSFYLSTHRLSNIVKLEEQVNEFLSTIEPEKIFQINYLNAAATPSSVNSSPEVLATAIITYWTDKEKVEIEA